MRTVTILALVVAVLGATACQSEEAEPGATAGPSAGAGASIIPADVSYSVLDTDTFLDVKRALEVRLNKKVTEDVLRAIAIELKSSDPQEYLQTFITYFLPGTAVGAGAWATTHFTPTLSVTILGLTPQEEQTLVAQPVPSQGEVIGSWLDQVIPSKLTIYREQGTLYLEQKFQDGSGPKVELLEKSSPSGRRFDSKESSFGEHWIVNGEGNLEVRDNHGLISVAASIQ